MLVLCLAGCPRPVPDHLRLDTDTNPVVDVAVTDLESAVQALIRRDPLARSLAPLDRPQLAQIEGGDALARFMVDLEAIRKGAAQEHRTLHGYEQRGRGTAALPLARGERLARIESALAQLSERNDALERDVLLMMVDLRPLPAESGVAQRPLAWITGTHEARPIIQAWADRYVLQGWLHAPGLPLQAVSSALDQATYDDLRASPVGTLLQARASRSIAAMPPGLDDLRLATELALLQAAADSDGEQKAMRERLTALDLGDDPVTALLDRTVQAHTAHAGDDRSAGAALLAIGALRSRDACSWEPCAGVDRTALIADAGGWHPELAPLASVWQVVALKNAIDTLDVARDRPSLRFALANVVDALAGTGAGPFNEGLLRRTTASESLWFELGTALGDDATARWEDLEPLLGEHLAARADAAAAGLNDASWRKILERVARRARNP